MDGFRGVEPQEHETVSHAMGDVRLCNDGRTRADVTVTVNATRGRFRMNATRVLTVLNRAFGAGAFILGLAFWLGYARSLTRLHIGLGIGLVLCLWLVSWIGWRRTHKTGLATLGVACGLISWIFGVIRSGIMPGAFHWVLEVTHLALGALMVVIGVLLAAAIPRHAIAAGTSPVAPQ